MFMRMQVATTIGQMTQGDLGAVQDICSGGSASSSAALKSLTYLLGLL